LKILVTGVAGFIGSFLARDLAQDETNIVLGIDNLAPYYSPNLKAKRIVEVLPPSVEFQKIDISERTQVDSCFEEFRPDKVFHLAAQPGVRLSVESHHKYTETNLTGFCNLLNSALRHNVSSIIYASSSSVYGDLSARKFSEDIKHLNPTSFYGATKLSNEILARSYSSRYGIKTRGLRFFTVYGPWGRPDMAYFRIIASLLLRKKFRLFGDGSIERDFTFIDDVVALTGRLGHEIDSQNEGFSDIVNVGGGSPVSILGVIQLLSELAEQELEVIRSEADPSDVQVTNADAAYRESLIGQYVFHTHRDGLGKSLNWAKQESLADLDRWLV
jgi:UDP-glucuronate 4-epimerase